MERIVENRTPEEELEYRRYLRKRIRMRKRRRKVMIARTIVFVLAMCIVFLLSYGIVKLTSGGGKEKKKPEPTAVPTATPLAVQVPEGYEEIYQSLYKLRENYPQMDDILLGMGQYPQELLELLAKNQETITFVSNYLMHVDDTKASGKIEEADLDQNIPLFIQWDERWGYVRYGDNIVAINGCGPTCMSMVYTGLTGETDKSPADVSDFSMENDYYTSESGTSWLLMTSGAEKLGLTAEQVVISDQEIKKQLKVGKPVICSMKPGDFTDTGHFIVLRGISDTDMLSVNDPNSRERSGREWELSQVVEQMKAAWSYSYGE